MKKQDKGAHEREVVAPQHRITDSAAKFQFEDPKPESMVI